jgi:RHS repeat-associated protein
VTDDRGLVLTSHEYLPFGEDWITEGDTKNAPKYNSQELDKESGYYFYNARHYDPEIGRFVTPDTVVDGELSTQGWNRFAYVHNNPIRYKDPTGHKLDDCTIKPSTASEPKPGSMAAWVADGKPVNKMEVPDLGLGGPKGSVSKLGQVLKNTKAFQTIEKGVENAKTFAKTLFNNEKIASQISKTEQLLLKNPEGKFAKQYGPEGDANLLKSITKPIGEKISQKIETIKEVGTRLKDRFGEKIKSAVEVAGDIIVPGPTQTKTGTFVEGVKKVIDLLK